MSDPTTAPPNVPDAGAPQDAHDDALAPEAAPAEDAAERAPRAESAPDAATDTEQPPAAEAAEEASEAQEDDVIEAFAQLGPIFERVVRALRPVRIIMEVQRIDRAAFFRNFKGHRIEKFGRPRMVEILRKEILQRRNERLAHLVIILWNDEMRDLYIAMRDHVRTIDENVEAIERIEDDDARRFVDDLLARQFALEDIYACVRLNGVRFSEAFIRDALMRPLGLLADE